MSQLSSNELSAIKSRSDTVSAAPRAMAARVSREQANMNRWFQSVEFKRPTKSRGRRCHRFAPSGPSRWASTIALACTLCHLVARQQAQCSTLAPHELGRLQDPLGLADSRVRIVTNTNPEVSSSETAQAGDEDDASTSAGLLDRFNRFRESLQRERLRDLQENFRERLDSIRSQVGAGPDRVYKLNIDLPVAQSRNHLGDHRQSEASSPVPSSAQVLQGSEQQGPSHDPNESVKYDDNLQDGESTRQRYLAPALYRNDFFRPDYSQQQFEQLTSSLADSLFGYYPPAHHRVARSVTLGLAQQQQQHGNSPDSSHQYAPTGSSPMVAHESPLLMPMINGHQTLPASETAQVSASVAEPLQPHRDQTQQQPDNVGSDSIWSHAGDPFDAPTANFGQRSSGARSAGPNHAPMSQSELEDANQFVQSHLGQSQGSQEEVPAQQVNNFAPSEPPSPLSSADQLKLASEEYSGDKYAMKSDGEESGDGEEEEDYKPAMQKKKKKKVKSMKKAYKAEEEGEEEHYEAPPPPPPPPPPKKIVIKKEMKHHHYHHHHHHHQEPKKQVVVVKKHEKPVVQTQPLHLEIHIKDKSRGKNKSKGKGKGKGKEKDKSKGKEGDEIYVKLNQGGGQAHSGEGYGSYGGYGGGGSGGGGGGGGDDEGSYVDGKSTGANLIEDKKSLVGDQSDEQSAEGAGYGHGAAQNKVPVRQIKKSRAGGDTPSGGGGGGGGEEEQEKPHEESRTGSESSSAPTGGEQEEEQGSSEGKSEKEVDRSEEQSASGGGGESGGDGSDVIQPSQVPDFGHFESFFDEGPINKHHAQHKHKSGGGEEKKEVGEAKVGAGAGQGETGSAGRGGAAADGTQEGAGQEHKEEQKHKKHEHKKQEKKEVKQAKEHKKEEKEEKEEKKEKEVEKEQHQPEVKKEEPVKAEVVAEKEQPKKVEGKHHEKVHKAKHAHIEVHQHKHFEHHQHINLQAQQPAEEGEHEQHKHEHGGEQELQQHDGIGGGGGVGGGGEIEAGHLGHEGHSLGGGGGEHMPIEPQLMHHEEMPMIEHHQQHQQPIIEPEHHIPIKEHWVAPDIHEKPPSKQHPHGAFVIEDHSELDKHSYEHPHNLHYKEEVINHPHGFGLTPVAAYNLMGAYSTRTTSHSSTGGSGGEKKSTKQAEPSQKSLVQGKPTRH